MEAELKDDRDLSATQPLRSGHNPLVFSMNFEQSKEVLGSALAKKLSDFDVRSKASYTGSQNGSSNPFKKKTTHP